MLTQRCLVVQDQMKSQPSGENTLVPNSVLDGMLTVLHIHLSHLSKYEMKCLFTRYIFVLSVNKMLLLKNLPQSEVPLFITASFAPDVSDHHHQLILVLRETVSPYTLASLVESGKHIKLRQRETVKRDWPIYDFCTTMKSHDNLCN